MKNAILLCFAATTAFSTELLEVTFKSDPAGALITIGSTMSGRTPAMVKLAPGKYHASISLPHFEDWAGDFVIEQGKPNQVQATLTKKGQRATAPEALPEVPVFSLDGNTPSAIAPTEIEQVQQDARREAALAALRQTIGGHSVEYRVVGDRDVSLTLGTGSGGTEPTKVALPWSYTFWGQKGEALKVSAQKKGNEGWVECQIYIDGKLVKQARAEADSAIVSISETVP